MRLSDIKARLGGEVIGEVDTPLTGVGTLEAGRAGQISFLANPKYRALLATTQNSAVIVGEKDRDTTALPRIVAKNPYAYFARVAQLFAPTMSARAGVHSSAVVHPTAQVHATATIAEFVSIGEGARIDEYAEIGAGCVIGEGAVIGARTRLMPRVTVYARCVVGQRGLIHSGVVIGADGFGFAPDFQGANDDNGEWVKIPQTGRVVIGDDFEIGANSTIDRGAIEDTVIGNDVKIDNQVQIGHNCTIGDHTVISGCTGIAGSTKIGKRVMMGGASGAIGHLSICDGAIVSAMTLVTKSITEPGMVTGSLPHMKHEEWLKNMVHIRRLDELARKIKKENT
ncbi:MAG: UDP-3-O-(3-hydroxymyristoyl)glucosamine N-acyltransferase [Betaproteobacteria bacterium]|nr:UDP-3-O-(3-hydroxymyristoyl)glucosamine N-acyltransferase [Betaproteobacteria bacterium]